jgi:hypothetical protein
MRATCSAHLILFDLFIYNIYHKLIIILRCNFILALDY